MKFVKGMVMGTLISAGVVMLYKQSHLSILTPFRHFPS